MMFLYCRWPVGFTVSSMVVFIISAFEPPQEVTKTVQCQEGGFSCAKALFNTSFSKLVVNS